MDNDESFDQFVDLQKETFDELASAIEENVEQGNIQSEQGQLLLNEIRLELFYLPQ